MRMKVIGTAGHIDHGKSALVRRLTGIDPDRLEEEKRRGMTIDLGFAWLRLPSGLEVSLVDVPGHERFIKNMLAGAAGIDVALLVVAADEGVMPQTREHLDILDLLDVHSGVVALTKVDLVDGEWREMVTEDVERLLAGTCLDGSPIVPVSSVTGEGVGDLLTALDAAVAGPDENRAEGVAYLPVDRVFTLPGFGTVVTGTLHGGAIVLGEEVQIAPGTRRARIRGLQSHGRQVERAEPGSRVAINLAGVARAEVERGDVVSRPGTVRSVRRCDAELRVLADAPVSLQHGMEARVHVGAAERRASVTVLGGDEIEPGGSGWVQLRFGSPVAALRGQRFIVRLPAPARTIAGGVLVDVVPRHRRFDAVAVDRLRQLRSDDVLDAVDAALPAARPAAASRLAEVLGLPPAQVQQTLLALERAGRACRLGSAYLSRAGWEGVSAQTRGVLADYHRDHPMRRGMPKEQLRRELGWTPQVWGATLKALEAAGVMVERESVVALPDHTGGTGERNRDSEAVLDLLRRGRFSPPSLPDVMSSTGVDADLIAALVEEGQVVRVSEGLIFARDAYDDLVACVLDLIDGDGEVTVAAVRDAAATSRKYALALLEHLDAVRVTRRLGDARQRGSKAPACG